MLWESILLSAQVSIPIDIISKKNKGFQLRSNKLKQPKSTMAFLETKATPLILSTFIHCPVQTANLYLSALKNKFWNLKMQFLIFVLF